MISTLITEESTSKNIKLLINGEEKNIHYNDTNNINAKDTIVMLHGSGPGASGWSNFHKNITPFVESNYRVILLDCLGWGKSDPIINTNSRSDINALTLKKLLEKLELKNIHLVGNSMGAHSAVSFALNYPGQLKRLILMGGGTGGICHSVPQPTEGIKKVGQVYRNPTLQNIQELLEIFVYDKNKLNNDLTEKRAQNILNNKEHLQNFVKSLEINPVQFPDVTYRLPEINHPTLILWGRNDRFLPLEIGLKLLAGIKNSELHVINECGHWFQWEFAEKFNKMVLDFISSE